MLICFTENQENVVVITPIIVSDFSQWLAQQTVFVQNWVKGGNFNAKPDTFCLVPNEQGQLAQVIIAIRDAEDFWPIGALSASLPVGNYQIKTDLKHDVLTRMAIAWGLGAYQFTRYKSNGKAIPKLVITENYDLKAIEDQVTAIYLVRDLINTPTDDLGPPELAQAAKKLAEQFSADVNILKGEELLRDNYPTIYTVGRASHKPPHLVDIRWGKATDPKITLVGKGVCFDSGGLDIKSSSQMLLMKKDMGGAAHALGLAYLIMSAQLPVCLRVLIPAVENVISSNAYHPGDVIKTRKGLTVEIGNTDAEGRLILCDALAEAASEKPELLIDFATLTGAARIAVGTEISALFTNRDEIAAQLIECGKQMQDPVWPLPLYAPYRSLIDSKIADINNAGASPYAGSITAALFLKEFVGETPWLHFDLMAWNVIARPGRPEGAEAMALRAVFEWLQNKYCRA